MVLEEERSAACIIPGMTPIATAVIQASYREPLHDDFRTVISAQEPPTSVSVRIPTYLVIGECILTLPGFASRALHQTSQVFGDKLTVNL